MQLRYEDLVADPAAAVAGIAALVGVEDAAINQSKVSAAVMRDGVSEEWRHRYLADAPPIEVFPGLTDRSPRALIDAARIALR